jgi:hypothetical protein
MSYRFATEQDKQEIIDRCDCGKRTRSIFGHLDWCASWSVPFTGVPDQPSSGVMYDQADRP